MRVVFMGSPHFALPALRRVADAYDVVAVYTQPDRAAGRGRRLTPPPAKALALERAIPVYQPPRLRSPAAVEELATLRPDLIVVAAYGQILPPSILALPKHGCVNIHASLLPRWRGASPISAAILAGDATTGVSIMRMDEGLDTGPVIAARALPIADDDTTGSLTVRLAGDGADLIIQTLPPYLEGSLRPVPQDDALATYAPPLTKADALVAPSDWSLSARDLWLRVRAYNPWPIATTGYAGAPLRIWKALPIAMPTAAPPGTVVALADPLTPAGVATGDGILALLEVQRPGKRPLPIAEFLRGERGFIGAHLA
ncbi:MAG: methionyl-tRNA formyltransferase [Dehalococcoidia bacterium]|nr:methionyl-tRNA formyltransferase [Dehalococcoidia bacterium]